MTADLMEERGHLYIGAASPHDIRLKRKDFMFIKMFAEIKQIYFFSNSFKPLLCEKAPLSLADRHIQLSLSLFLLT